MQRGAIQGKPWRRCCRCVSDAPEPALRQRTNYRQQSLPAIDGIPKAQYPENKKNKSQHACHRPHGLNRKREAKQHIQQKGKDVN